MIDHEKDLQINNNKIENNKINNGDLILGVKNIFNPPKADPQALLNLIERCKKLAETDEEYRNFIEELNFFLEPRPGRPRIGLEEKLKQGDRLDLLDDGTLLENKFARRIARQQLSRTAQAIYLHCLSKINTAFSSKIRPLIQDGASKIVIDNAIHDYVVLPIHEEVCAADASLTTEMVRGMLFFLTDKCHTKWN